MTTNQASKPTTSRWHIASALLGGIALLGMNHPAQAGIGTSQTPTEMTLKTDKVEARRGKDRVTATAKVTRVDTGAAVQSALVTFYFGNPRFPNSRVGSAYTNAAGEARITFWVSEWTGTGRNLLLAEFTGNNIYAQPLPYTSIKVTNRP